MIGPVLILGRGDLASAVAAAVTLRLAPRGPALVVAVARPGDSECGERPQRGLSVPPTVAAARFAAGLRAAGHPAHATWRLVASRVASAEEALAVIAKGCDGGLATALALERPVEEEDAGLLSSCPLGLVALTGGAPASLADEAAQLPRSAGCWVGFERFDEPGLSAVVATAGIAAPAAWVEGLDRWAQQAQSEAG